MDRAYRNPRMDSIGGCTPVVHGGRQDAVDRLLMRRSSPAHDSVISRSLVQRVAQIEAFREARCDMLWCCMPFDRREERRRAPQQHIPLPCQFVPIQHHRLGAVAVGSSVVAQPRYFSHARACTQVGSVCAHDIGPTVRHITGAAWVPHMRIMDTPHRERPSCLHTLICQACASAVAAANRLAITARRGCTRPSDASGISYASAIHHRPRRISRRPGTFDQQ